MKSSHTLKNKFVHGVLQLRSTLSDHQTTFTKHESVANTQSHLSLSACADFNLLFNYRYNDLPKCRQTQKQRTVNEFFVSVMNKYTQMIEDNGWYANCLFEQPIQNPFHIRV